jgi:predicted transcriptional regulator YdeE
MKKTLIQKPEIKLMGITARTSNNAEFNPMTAKIGLTMANYFAIASKIPNTKNPGVTFCAYTDYESDYTREYTYFIGQEVTSFDDVSKDYETLIIPSQNYACFTTTPGPMPMVVINAWQDIWKMSDAELGSKRSYITDFEVYDERALNPLAAIADIYIGIN